MPNETSEILNCPDQYGRPAIIASTRGHETPHNRKSTDIDSRTIISRREHLSCRSSVPLEVLYCAFVLLCFFQSREGAQVAALARLGIFLSRIQSKFSGFEFANHVSVRCASRAVGRPMTGPREDPEQYAIFCALRVKSRTWPRSSDG